MSSIELSAGVPDLPAQRAVERAGVPLRELWKRAHASRDRVALDQYRAALVTVNVPLRSIVLAGVVSRTFEYAGLTARAKGEDVDPAKDRELAQQCAFDQARLVAMVSRFQTTYDLDYLEFLARDIPRLDDYLGRYADAAVSE